MKRAVLILIILFTATFAYGADEMRKLDFLLGDWTGEAWIQMGPGKPQTVVQNEKVTAKVGGKAFLVEGLGREKLADGALGKVVHETVALIWWDEQKKTYRFDAHTADKGSVDTTIDLTAPNTAVWGFDTPQGKVRYTIRLTEKGEWSEIGEFSRDGTKWMKFFEMTLTKK
ncbi:MAG TPA: hypothetical protein VEK79_22545 [Thermoanaerobaculia bacterium]|nr:hypothetical protein [Thermoanaerobaculia bacterium]